ncbi:MAG: 3'(2'),5'-bisphosphate nucleotidase CysQ [Acidobacteriota bacterium]|nr:3'(2'),5'-bisphosphate nucleotidase CysQ [Acidobacteriota bacterium]MDQ7087664.1 3'(2'),5'-bisphosphate nucleotidase CysQ [Acidobacteriota bacterium]
MKRELEVALEAAMAAGREVSRIYREGFDVRQKGAEGPVTTADLRADEVIRQILGSAFPDDAQLSEERPDDPARMGRSRLWLIDPLDGTHQFVDRIGEFAVMIGLALEGRSVLGVVHLPEEQLTLAALEGAGAFVVEASGHRRFLELEPWSPALGAPRVTVSRSHAGPRTRQVLDRLQPSRVLRSGSVGRKACLVALGRADAYFSLGRRSSHWDACAPEIIVREAGGVFLQADGRPFRYNLADVRNRQGLLAARPGLASTILEAATSSFEPGVPEHRQGAP